MLFRSAALKLNEAVRISNKNVLIFIDAQSFSGCAKLVKKNNLGKCLQTMPSRWPHDGPDYVLLQYGFAVKQKCCTFGENFGHG